MDWSKLPDLVAIGLLAGAFASVARQNRSPFTGYWLSGWLLIVLHFVSDIFLPLSGIWGNLSLFISMASLIGAGFLFMRATVPYRQEISSRFMHAAILTNYMIYLIIVLAQGPALLLDVVAVFIGLAPLVITLSVLRHFQHRLRWALVSINISLACILLLVQNRPGDGGDLALDAMLFMVYFGCGIHFWHMYRRASAGSLITVAGFFAWASVFAVSPYLNAYFPRIHIEDEVWNLPKYVVAVGMILLLLEDQIAHNRHLALHDELTGLPNRRLFQDRLSNTLERARRTGTHAALLLLDLDHFKQVNDTLGHHVGDQLLQHVAKLFKGRIRRSDTVARTGGDEFSFILDGPINTVEAALVGNSLLELLEHPMPLGERSVPIQASLGVAIFPDDAQDLESLCIAADMRMYDNKRARQKPGSAAQS